VKHARDAHFNESTLKNALNALGALLILAIHHYSSVLNPTAVGALPVKDTTLLLQPDSTLLRLDDDFYHSTLIC
jgi:hypothetical protein